MQDHDHFESRPHNGYPQNIQMVPQGPQHASYPLSNEMFGTSDQIHLVNPSNQVFTIETQIKSGPCCYTCLVYFGFINSALAILSVLWTSSHPPTQVVSAIIAIPWIVGSYLAIKAKSTFDSKKQHQAYIVFGVMMVLRLIIGLLFAKPAAREWTQSLNQGKPESHRYELRKVEASIFLSVYIGLILDLLLVYYSYGLFKLMKHRDQILISLNSVNRNV